MTESVSIDVSLSNVWVSWYAFRKGKRRSHDIDLFEYYLEENLGKLSLELENGSYQPGAYRTFTVTDNKRREISVAPVRDRVVHRLLYDYLVSLYDSSFIYDAWSCRKGKGLVGAIERAQRLLAKCSSGYVWRSDVTKFFDSVNHEVLLALLARRVKDDRVLRLITTMTRTYTEQLGGGVTQVSRLEI